MIPTLTCFALACVGGVDLGYQPARDGGLELIVQVDPRTFQTLRPNDPINVDVRPEAQKVPASKITLVLGDDPLPHKLPPPSTSASEGLAPPATAPLVTAAPMPAPSVRPTLAEMPSSTNGPALDPSGGQGPQQVPPPEGGSIAPPRTNVVPPGAADGARSTGFSRNGNEKPLTVAAQQYPDGTANPLADRPAFQDMADPGDVQKAVPIDVVRLLLVLTIIALAASNGYVGWLFYDARQRYLGLLSRMFAKAQ